MGIALVKRNGTALDRGEKHGAEKPPQPPAIDPRGGHTWNSTRNVAAATRVLEVPRRSSRIRRNAGPTRDKDFAAVNVALRFVTNGLWFPSLGNKVKPVKTVLFEDLNIRVNHTLQGL